MGESFQASEHRVEQRAFTEDKHMSSSDGNQIVTSRFVYGATKLKLSLSWGRSNYSSPKMCMKNLEPLGQTNLDYRPISTVRYLSTAGDCHAAQSIFK